VFALLTRLTAVSPVNTATCANAGDVPRGSNQKAAEISVDF